jgi:hypothetical protein
MNAFEELSQGTILDQSLEEFPSLLNDSMIEAIDVKVLTLNHMKGSC